VNGTSAVTPIELILPTTDRGVALQVIAVLFATGVGLYLTRRDRDIRLLVTGGSLVVLGLMAVRALH
jgi:hypothetical protein